MAKKVKKIKLKTNRGAMKRFRLSGTGKVRFRRAKRAHIRTKQTAKQVAQGRANGVLKECDAKLVRRLLQAVGA